MNEPILIINTPIIMALQISENNGTFFLQGNINASTSKYLTTHIERTMNTVKQVTVDIAKVSAIDTNGVAALKKLFLNASNNNKTFSIVGYGCKDLYNEFNMSTVG